MKVIADESAPMKPLPAALLVALTACATAESGPPDYWASHDDLRGRVGTDICAGCRLEQEVRLGRARAVLEEVPSTCSQWVMQQMPDHAHGWVPVGCWGGADFSMVCEMNGWLSSRSSDEWLAYLQSLSSDRCQDVVAMATADRASAQQAVQNCKTWMAQQRTARAR